MTDMTPFTTPKTHSGRLLKMAEVRRETSLHPATIYRQMHAGTFPRQVRIGLGRVGWWESDIEAWKLACTPQTGT
jgi:prophage regulatory protein